VGRQKGKERRGGQEGRKRRGGWKGKKTCVYASVSGPQTADGDSLMW